MLRFLLLLILFLNLRASIIDDMITKGDKFFYSHNYDKSSLIYQKAYEEAKRQGSNSLGFESLEKLIKSLDASNKDSRKYKSEFSRLRLPVLEKHTPSKTKITLRFNMRMQEDYYRSFRLSDNIFVIDIYGKIKSDRISFKHALADKVVIAQNKRALFRIVLDGDSAKEYKVSVWKNYIIIEDKNKIKKEEFPKKNEIIKASNKKIVVIDPGHGGRDSGAIGVCKLKEKNLVLSISKELVRILKKRKYKVFMTRKSNRYVGLTKRTSLANKKNAHIFISVHGNSMPKTSNVSGVEMYFLSPAKTSKAKRVAEAENAVDLKAMEAMSKATFLNFLNREKIVSSNKLAIDLQNGILKSLRKTYKVRDGGVREGPFWVLVGAQMPAVLAEVGFLSNKKECKRLKKKSYQKLIANGLANGVDNFFIHNTGF